MERLTYEKSRNRWDEGKYPTKYTSRHTFQEVVARLAAYEDAMPIERAQEIVQAEKDGRLVVLPPNDPLTLDELREMEGEPVWVEYGDAGEWVIASSDPIEILRRLGDTPYLLSLHSYAKGWAAYRRKPEEGAV